MDLADALDANDGSLKSETLYSPWSNLSVRFEVIGAEQADKYLETYEDDYRRLRQSHAEALASDMDTDNWRPDGDTIKFMEKPDGAIVLGDGQHRLTAIKISGIAQEMIVVEGVPVVAYDTMGVALPRNFADALRRDAFTNTLLRQALVSLIERWELGRSLGDTKKITNARKREIHTMYVKEINRAMDLTVGRVKRVDMPAAMIAFSWFILRSKDEVKAMEFMEGLLTGAGTYMLPGNPIITLSNFLKDHAEDRLTRMELAHYVFQAWNAFREEDPIEVAKGQPPYRKLYRLQKPSGIVTRENMAEPK